VSSLQFEIPNYLASYSEKAPRIPSYLRLLADTLPRSCCPAEHQILFISLDTGVRKEDMNFRRGQFNVLIADAPTELRSRDRLRGLRVS
jgi:hypothetical protein